MSLQCTYKTFEWQTYLKINKDLDNNIINNKELAWKHWITHGNHEGRALSLINNSRTHKARFGNLFFINMAIHFISLKNKLNFDYKYYNQFKELGIDLFIGNQTFSENIILTDNNFFDLVLNDNLQKNIIINNDISCQTSNFCIF